MTKKRSNILKMFFITAFIYFTAMAGGLSADEIVIAADQWCPYNCNPQSETPGFMVEIPQLIFGENGHRVTYKIVPWNRAQKKTHKGKYQAIIAGTPENTKGFSPPFVFPANEQGRMRNCFFVLKGNSWKYAGTDSLKTQRLGIIQGYGYPSIQSHIKKNSDSFAVQSVYGENALFVNIRKLIKGRISVILEDEAVFRHTAAKMGLADRFIIAGDDGTEPEKNNLYIAFTPEKNNPKSAEYAEILSDGMTKIRKNGKLDELLEKYALHDWK